MKVSDFNYELPKELIAQHPLEKRDSSRLMVLNREKKTIEHKVFKDIIGYLNKGDCLVINNTKVIPARLYGKKINGTDVEFLLLKNLGNDIWETMVRPGRRLKEGDIVEFGMNDNVGTDLASARGQSQSYINSRNYRNNA